MNDYISFLESTLSLESSFLHFLESNNPWDVLRIVNQKSVVVELQKRLAQAKLLEVQ